LIGLFFLATLTFTCFRAPCRLLMDKNFHYDEKHIGYLFAYCGVMAAFIQGGAIGRLVKKVGEERLIFSSLLVVAVSLAMIPYTGGLAALLVALALFSAGSGINRAPTMGLISLNSPPEEQGATFGVAQSAGTLARCIGPVLATFLYSIRTHCRILCQPELAIVASVLCLGVPLPR